MNISSLQLAQLIANLLEDKKAENTITLDLTNKGAFVDYMVITSALSGRQAAALADYVSQLLKQKGIKPYIEGLEQSNWVLIDGGDVLVHIFKPDIRSFYNLEKMWGEPNVSPKLISEG